MRTVTITENQLAQLCSILTAARKEQYLNGSDSASITLNFMSADVPYKAKLREALVELGIAEAVTARKVFLKPDIEYTPAMARGVIIKAGAMLKAYNKECAAKREESENTSGLPTAENPEPMEPTLFDPNTTELVNPNTVTMRGKNLGLEVLYTYELVKIEVIK